ncbi:unnamed protein product [Cylindrotheca closterium]|uniref:DNA polymerase V n=1 Tax=Cylindrotheca closterium TaxID=2856 RepID=A0AAD2CZ23_9STRA|nr:unnamed protein product [Cylindrotheca closterium]
MRKRKTSSLDEVDSSGSEMEVDGEEKMDVNEVDDVNSSDEQSEAEEPATHFVPKDNPFLDSFYGLSSEDPRERSNSAKTMLHQCLLGPDANSKDASYALRRLLNGLCSGRAAARQGNASALTSFLKASFQLDKIQGIRSEMEGDDPTGGTPLSFIRTKLLAATDPNQISGKKKGSEERDYQFGRLFGILGVIRSGILLPDDYDDDNMSNVVEVVSGFVEDLAELFWLKRWMREPATHGIATLLKSFYQGSPEKACTQILNHIVNRIVIPKVFLKEEGERSLEVVLETYCAEQIGLACFIQSRAGPRGDKLSFPLNEAVLSAETVILISDALAETSVVVQPRMHFVWDSLWCYLFEMKNNEGGKEIQWELQETCAINGGKAVEILEQIVKTIVVKKLLGIDSEKGGGTSKATHERRSLALCIVKTLCGVTFASSICGPSKLLVDNESIGRFVLSPSIIRRLFVDTICAGKQNKSQSSHLLKPLALEVLASMSSSYSTTDATTAERRLTIAKAFLKAEVRFDSRTKTSAVEDMLGLTVAVEEQNEHFFALVDHYLRFLKDQFLSACADADESTALATGFVEAMYSAVKRIIRVDGENKAEVALWKKTSVRGVVNFFMASAFFDCSDVKNSKGKKKKRKSTGDQNSIRSCATSVKDVEIPHSIRSIISARFFSLVADCIHQETHQKSGTGQGKLEKDAIALSFLSETHQGWLELETAGAKRYSNATVSDDDKSENPDAHLVIQGIGKMMTEISDAQRKNPENSLIEAKKRCCTGVSTFAYTLYLHRLNCTKDGDEMDDNPDADEEDDEEEICSALTSLNEILQDFMAGGVEENPLSGLSELCANILSSPLGSGEIGRGASPKLIRESVKFAWLGGLKLSSALATKDRTFLDSEVVSTLMDAVGANAGEDDEMDGEDSNGDGDSSDGEDDERGMHDEDVFSKASNLIDSESMEVDDEQERAVSEEDESDVVLDQDKLQSMLEEDSDSDADPDVLEHHEGADAALAKLIRLKQGARKAGQQAREKIEVQNQLRCTILLELLFGRPDAWNNLFRTEIVASMLLPLLRLRKKTEKSMDKATENRQKSGYAEKRSLVEKLTSLLTTKIFKLKVSSMPMSSLLGTEMASKLIESIADEVRRTESKDQSKCCSNAIAFLLRNVENVEEVISSISTFENLVEEWSNKRSTRIGGSFFDELIVHSPHLSQAILLSPLAKATQSGRSPFLKTEVFRILSLLFAARPSSASSEAEKIAADCINSNQQELLAAITKTLEDEEMKKPKRARAVLKAVEKFVPCIEESSSECLEKLDAMKSQVVKLEASESNAIKSACNKLVGEIDGKISAIKKEYEKLQQQSVKSPTLSSSTKKKKKKKKKR